MADAGLKLRPASDAIWALEQSLHREGKIVTS